MLIIKSRLFSTSKRGEGRGRVRNKQRAPAPPFIPIPRKEQSENLPLHRVKKRHSAMNDCSQLKHKYFKQLRNLTYICSYKSLAATKIVVSLSGPLTKVVFNDLAIVPRRQPRGHLLILSQTQLCVGAFLCMLIQSK